MIAARRNRHCTTLSPLNCQFLKEGGVLMAAGGEGVVQR